MKSILSDGKLVWLLCDLLPHRKTIVRQGWRQGLPTDQPPYWVFCPLMRKNFPSDRVPTSYCEKCSHFIAYAKVEANLSLQRVTPNVFSPWEVSIKKQVSQRNYPWSGFCKELIEQASREKEKKDKEWLEEERLLFGDAVYAIRSGD